jgi:sec-independent protein translocase protein TatB
VFNLQGSEIIVILLLALVVLGPEKLPGAIKRFTQTYGELKKMGNGFQSELKSALDEPMREMQTTADMIRDAADPRRMTAEADAEQRLHDETEPVTPSAPSAPTAASPPSPPRPFASSADLGSTPLPAPDGPPSLDLPPPGSARRTNGHAASASPWSSPVGAPTAPDLPSPHITR